MKKAAMAFLSLCMLFSLGACSFRKENGMTENNATGDKGNNTENQKDDGSISDVMDYFKSNNISYRDDKDITKFDWAAKEGKSFVYDGNTFYLYKVDTTDKDVAAMLEKVQTSNAISATQNGTTKEYGAMNNGSYLLIYDKDAAVDKMQEIFSKYKYETKKDAK